MENNMRKLFRRCVQCPDTTPSCPACASDETCTLSSQTCDTCPSTSCIKTSISGPTSAPPSSGGSKAGPIAGGVVGGVVAIVIITLIIWKFYWKPRRAQYMGEEWPEEDASAEKNGQFTMQRNARASTHTIGSIASTVLTRASNVIQIAYIPGVTNRSATEMIPPVPPVPLGIHVDSARSSPRVEEEQHFFMPGDLRDSTYTGVSDLDGRSSFARTSIAPSLARSSVATTIYRDNAVVHMPAQAAYGGRANVVSVRFPGSSSGENTPPVPAIDYAKHGQKGLSVPDGADTKPPPSPAFSVGSTFLSSKADIAQAVTATPINLRTATKGNAKDEVLVSDASSVKTFGVQKSARNSTSNPTKDESRLSQSHDESIEAPFTLDDAFTEDEGGFLLIRTDGDEEPQASRASGVTEIEDASPLRSPFTDQAAVTSTDIPERRHSRTGSNGLENLGHRRRQSGSLTKVVEEASKDDREGLLSNSSHRNSSPFSDSNEVRGL